MSQEHGDSIGLAYTRAALRGLRRVEPPNRRRALKEMIDTLPADVRAVRAERLQGVEYEGRPVYRFRLGPYRVLYTLDRQEILVLDIGHRREIYRRW